MAFDANKTYLRVGTDPNSKVKKIDGKGLGWVANKDMKRGSKLNQHMDQAHGIKMFNQLIKQNFQPHTPRLR